MSKEGTLNRIAKYKQAIIDAKPQPMAYLTTKLEAEEAFFKENYGSLEKESVKKSK